MSTVPLEPWNTHSHTHMRERTHTLTHTLTPMYIGHSGPAPMQLQPKLRLSIIPNYRGNRAAPRQPADWLCDPECRRTHTPILTHSNTPCTRSTPLETHLLKIIKTHTHEHLMNMIKHTRVRSALCLRGVCVDFTLHHVCRGRPYVFAAAHSHYTHSWFNCALCMCEKSE